MDDAALGITFGTHVTIVELPSAAKQRTALGADFEMTILYEDMPSIPNAVMKSFRHGQATG